MHAAWNLLTRRTGAEITCLWRMQIVIVLLGALPALVGLYAFHCMTPTAWLCLVGSGVSCGLYYVGLGRGYATGDFTTVYPAARALPVLLVGVFDLSRGRCPTAGGWLGMVLVAVGCLLVPLQSIRRLRAADYLNRSTLWIVVTALGTVGYSAFDKVGTESISPGPGQAAVYGYFFYLFSALCYGLLAGDRRGGGTEDKDCGWLIPAAVGILCFMAYWLVLWAYQMTPRASYVVALRQFSIVVGVVLSFLLFHEPGRRVRLAGAILITAGLLVLHLWGSEGS